MIAQELKLAQNGEITVKRTMGATAGVEVLFNIKTEQDRKGRQVRKVYREKDGRWTKLGLVEGGVIGSWLARRRTPSSRLSR